MNTLLLDRTVWDLCKDANGNIAMASDPYSVAQDVASAIRLFAGELYYDTSKGVPWFADILGQGFAPAAFQADVIAAALTVPGVTSAVCSLGAFANRNVVAQVQVTADTGETFTVTIGQSGPIQPFVVDLDFSKPSNSGYLPGL